MTTTPKLDLVIIDCPDALELAQFYAGILDWAVEAGSGRDWATLVPPGGGLSPDNPDGRTTLAFQRIDDFVEPTWPGRCWPRAPAGTTTSPPPTAASGSSSIPPATRSA